MAIRTLDALLSDFKTRISRLERRLAIGGITPSGGGGAPAAVAELFKADEWTGHLGEQLIIPTFISPAGGQTTHPSVVYVENYWNGYRYWMGHTPYPNGDDSSEDPSIVASQDGNTWVTPVGLTNPIDDQPGSPGAYNSDTELVLGPDNQLWLFWRTFDSSIGSNQEKIYLSKSTNGIAWSSKVLIYQQNSGTRRLVSPSFIFEDGAWTMWAVNLVPNPNTMVKLRSTGQVLTDTGDWGAPVICSIDYIQSGKEPWHLEVRKVGEQYVCLLNDCTLNQSGTNGDLFLMVSVDGVTWKSGRKPVIPKLGSMSQRNYRGTFVVKKNGSGYTLDTFYGAWSTASIWNIFRTDIAPIGLIGEDSGWIDLGLPVGFADLDGINTAVRKVGNEVEIRIAALGTIVSGTTYVITGLPLLMRPHPDIVRAGGSANSRPGTVSVLPRNHPTNAGDVQFSQWTGGDLTWFSARISYRLG